MTMTPALAIMRGTTTHSRFAPFRRSFTYPVTMIDIDIERLAEADQSSNWFSVDRCNLLSFYSQDRGNRGEKGLLDWARDRFRCVGLSIDDRTIRLVTFPRTVGFSFAPISLWILQEKSGKLVGMIYEVNNTFGDDHAYVASIPASSHRHIAPKQFHVSPYFDVSGHYRFTLQSVGEKLDLLIENFKDEKRVHTATLSLTRQETSTRVIRQTALTSLFSGIGVVARIHWQALLLWMKGARYHSRKNKTRNAITQALSDSSTSPLKPENTI